MKSVLHLRVSRFQAPFQHGNDLGENPLPQFPNEVPECPSGHFALVGALATEEGQQEGDEGGEDLT